MRRSAFEIALGSDDERGQATGLSGFRFATGRKGPRILLTGAVHGDEVTATAALWHAMEQLEDWVSVGSLTVIPCVNQLGARASQRFVPHENTDINRVFPGRKDGPLGQRVAAALVELLADHDALIDVHTAGRCVPFIWLDHFHDRRTEALTVSWAQTSGLPLIAEMPAAITQLTSLDRSWSGWGVRQRKPAITMELAGFHTLEHLGAHRGANAILNMLTAAPKLFARPPRTPPKVSLQRDTLHAEQGGLFEAELNPGDSVGRGERIGYIRNFRGDKLAEVKTPKAAMILEIQPLSAVHVGMRLATLAVKRTAK